MALRASWRRLSGLFCAAAGAAFPVLVAGAGERPSEEAAWRPVVRLRWFDPHRALGFPDALLEAEVEHGLAGMGLACSWSRLAPSEALGSGDILVVGMLEPGRRGLPPDLMGTASLPDATAPAIHLWLPVIRRTVGEPPGRLGPAAARRVAKGAARVALHELVHVLVPERRHARGGPMCHRLTARDLLRADWPMEDIAGPDLRAAVAARWRHPEPVAQAGLGR